MASAAKIGMDVHGCRKCVQASDLEPWRSSAAVRVATPERTELWWEIFLKESWSKLVRGS